jgi:hypothetical protein
LSTINGTITGSQSLESQPNHLDVTKESPKLASMGAPNDEHSRAIIWSPILFMDMLQANVVGDNK